METQSFKEKKEKKPNLKVKNVSLSLWQIPLDYKKSKGGKK